MVAGSAAQPGRPVVAKRRLGLKAAVDAVIVEDQMDAFGLRVVPADKLPQLEDEQLAVLAVGLDPRQPARPALSAPARYRFWFLPGVRTVFCVPRSIQSGPILGLRWMSTSST